MQFWGLYPRCFVSTLYRSIYYSFSYCMRCCCISEMLLPFVFEPAVAWGRWGDGGRPCVGFVCSCFTPCSPSLCPVSLGRQTRTNRRQAEERAAHRAQGAPICEWNGRRSERDSGRWGQLGSLLSSSHSPEGKRRTPTRVGPLCLTQRARERQSDAEQGRGCGTSVRQKHVPEQGGEAALAAGMPSCPSSHADLCVQGIALRRASDLLPSPSVRQ
jgi:hypothetical protein